MPYEEEDTCVTIDHLLYGYMSYEERIHAV